MQFALADAGWRVARVTPFGGLEWVAALWIDGVAALLSGEE